MKKITLIQATMLEGSPDYLGLLDLFLHQVKSSLYADLFKPTVVVVPNLTTANWLKDKIALQLKICSNFEFVTFEQLIRKYYQINNPEVNLFDFDDALFMIYDFIMNIDLSSKDFATVSQYISNEDGHTKNLAKSFQLAKQLKTIFHEYLYLRTSELLTKTLQNKLPLWQKYIWQHLIQKIAEQQQNTYLDIYNYYQNSSQLSNLPAELFIFNLNNIYPSGCEILSNIALHSEISWYSLTISDQYYGDLLSSASRAKLQQKILKEPYLSVSDLSFTDGNQLVANLGQQSREFNELILANNINIINLNSFETKQTNHDNISDYLLQPPRTLLTLIQHDIKQLIKRISPEYWLNPHLDCYAKPIIFDLADESITINVCYNRMREVQELFNQVCALLNTDKTLNLSDILIVAPDINEYGAYIDAVFGNEYAAADGELAKLPYVITGNILKRDFKIIDCIKKIINIPYEIPVSFLFDFLSQDKIMHCLDLDANDLNLIFLWIKDNKTRFGYDATDYSAYGYSNFDIHSLKRFLTNITLGLTLSEDFVFNNSEQLPWLKHNQDAFIFYDNIENTQLELVDKLINVIDLLLLVRSTVYSAYNKYRDLHLNDIIDLVEHINLVLNLEDDAELTLSEFIGKLKSIKLAASVNVLLITNIIDDYCSSFNTKVIFTGKLTFASMQAVRNIPSIAIFMLGINFGEFPRQHVPNKLSILAKEWAVADRNANLEDKQLFLDVILAAKKYLRISYIGRNQQDNSEIKPAPVLSLLLEVIQNSVINQDDTLKQIIKTHALHPFYNNTSINYSVFWDNITPTINDLFINKRWCSTKQHPPITLDPQQQKNFLSINLKILINTFCYTNINLLKVIGVSRFKDDEAINDYEGFNLIDYELKSSLYSEFSKINIQNKDLNKLYTSGDLQHYMATKGILGYGDIGHYQFNLFYNLYQKYTTNANSTSIDLNYAEAKIGISLIDKVELDAENNLVVMEDFVAIRPASDMDNYPISYKLRIKCFLYLLLLHCAKFSHPHNKGLVIPDGVILKLISQEGNTINYRADFLGNVDPSKLFANVLGFYFYSLTNPVLIHRSAIRSYLDTIEDNKRISNAQKSYEEKFKNSELEKLCCDPIFGDIATDYFNKCAPKDNTILVIGSILKNMQLTKL